MPAVAHREPLSICQEINCSQMFPSWRVAAILRRKNRNRFSELVVGAPRFELGTSCAQARRVMFWKSFPRNIVFENKRIGEKFGCGKKYEIVAPHAQSPPNFPHSQRQSQGVSYEEGGELTGGDDARGFMTSDHQQPALVAGHKIICLARLRQGQQVVVAWVR